MARATTRTILPLDTFAKVIGISPLYFNQVELHDIDPTGRAEMQPATPCDMPIPQYEWQSGAGDCVGREEIARAIADAEALLTKYSGFTPGVTWIRDEGVTFPRLSNPNLINFWGRDLRGRPPRLQAKYGYVRMGGIEAVSLIDANASITYSDLNGDGYDETATIVATVATNVLEDEVAIYYPGHVGDAAWEIRPIQVRIDATTHVATITCRREQLVTEEILEAFVAQAAQGETDADFLTEVDVYRHYNDPSSQVSLIYSNGSFCSVCGTSGCAVCTSSIQTGCLAVADTRLGLVAISPGEWNSTNNSFDFRYYLECQAPDRLTLSYRAGYADLRLRNPLIEMDSLMARATSYLALSLLDRPLCTCENIRAKTAWWSEDLAVASSTPSGGSQTSRLSTGLLDNPFGTTRGAIFAWRLVQRERLGEAV